MAFILPSQHFLQFFHSNFLHPHKFENNNVIPSSKRTEISWIRLISSELSVFLVFHMLRVSWTSCCSLLVLLMAQLLSSVCTDTLKFQNPYQILCPRNRFTILGRSSVNLSSNGGKRKGVGRIRVASQGSASYEDIADDYYSVLGLVIWQFLLRPWSNFKQFSCLYVFITSSSGVNTVESLNAWSIWNL